MSQKTFLKTGLIISVFLLGMMNMAVGDIIYVDPNAPGSNNGSSWENAYFNLYDALAVAQYGDEIRVAEGIYKPDTTGLADPREATFQLINGVAIYGGYAGFGNPNPDACNPNIYNTPLSGDLAGNDVEVSNLEDLLDNACRVDNSYHVITGSGTDPNSILDGFTITAGNANSSWPYNIGGGMFNDGGSPTVNNCTFISNSAEVSGGGMSNSSSNPMVTSAVSSNRVSCSI